MITFANGQNYNTVRIFGSKKTYQGMERDTLAISIPSTDITLDEAKALWKNAEATAEITITSDEQTNVVLNYSMPIELIVENLKISESESVEVVTLKLAQKSDLEIAQEKQATDIQDTQVALMELAELVTA